jgi:type II secretory pathway component GspD/PulD (secretin)
LQNPTGPLSSGDLTATLQANEGIERASIVHSGTLVTLSDQPAPLQVARQIAFLERVTGSDTSVSLEPGVIDVGLFMTVLPRIVENDKILMRLSIAITDADPNFRQFGTDEVQIELPEIETTGFLQNAVVGNGETMVLAGFEKRSNSLSETTNPFTSLLGGRSNASRGRDMLVLVMHSRILPEQPITVVGQ